MTEPDSPIEKLFPEDSQVDLSPGSSQDSVRTTFSLSTEAIDILERLSERTGKTRKALLSEVVGLVSEACEEQDQAFQEVAESLTIEEEVRKSMVLRPKTRTDLNRLKEETDFSRNRLVEVGVRLAGMVSDDAIQKKIGAHECVLSDLKSIHDQVEEAQSKLTEQVGENDPVDLALFGIGQKLRRMIVDIEQEIESGEPLREDHEFF